jgi:uncharacterized integral membrane protein
MDDAAPDTPAQSVERRGLVWPVWVVGLIGILAAIVYVFVVAAR